MKKRILAVCILLALVVAAVYLWPREEVKKECPDNPKVGRWYYVTPEGAVNSDGTPWCGQLKLGRENRVMVYLLGGGVSLDEYSASQSYTAVGNSAFYYDRDDGVSDARLKNGIGSNDERNPFRDWTTIVVPYTTADFHAGAGEAGYTAQDGSTQVIHHNGYANCTALLKKVSPLVGEPDALLITGYSAGGFGAAMLAEDIIGYFPETENITVCVDGALLVNENWKGVARDRWHAPEKILERMTTGNLCLDHLSALHEARGNVKILFTCSTRDGGLAKYQSYIDGNTYAPSEAYGDVMEENLRVTVAALQENIPGCGVYIWNHIPYTNSGTLTKHTILYSKALFEPVSADVSIAEWISDAVDGRVESYGLELLEQ